MNNIKTIILMLGFFTLCSCAANPMKNLNEEGRSYFKDQPISYQKITFNLTSHDERKAIKSGYMSNEAAKDYVYNSLTQRMQIKNLLAEQGVDIVIDLKIKRIYSWGGSSMAVLNYTANVQLLSSEKKLGEYRLQGDIKDGSILGDHKAVFGLNKPDNEGSYFDEVVNSVISSLPKNK